MRPGEGDPELTRHIAWGPGPRAAQSLMLACRARALAQGRFAPSKADVLALAAPVLKHRMALTYSARADGETIDAVIERLKQRFALMAQPPGASPSCPPKRRGPIRKSGARRSISRAACRPWRLRRGRRRRRAGRRPRPPAAGMGENFWQFRPFIPGEARANVDWRRSARDDRLYVREREWEAAQVLWVWADLSAIDELSLRPGLRSPSSTGRWCLSLALADSCVRAGERTAGSASRRLSAARDIVDSLAMA